VPGLFVARENPGPADTFLVMAQLPMLPPLDVQIPDWPEDALVDRPCPGCDEPNSPVLRRPDGLPVAYCSACALWYVCHAPTDEALGSFYRDYWNEHRPVALDRMAAQTIRQRAKIDGRIDPRIHRLAALHNLTGRRVLDVGCGAGATLVKLAGCGAIPVGVDVNEEVCRFVEQRFGFEVHAGMLADARLETGDVDAAIMVDLLEHPLDFQSLLREVCRVVAPGGLVVIWTPNGGEAGSSVETAQSWVGFRVNLEHMQYFSPASILNLARKHGLAIEHLEALGTAGIAGLDRHRNRASIGRLRRSIGMIPGVRWLRRNLAGPNPAYSRSGSYCLFAILRIPEQKTPDITSRNGHELAELAASGVSSDPARCKV